MQVKKYITGYMRFLFVFITTISVISAGYFYSVNNRSDCSHEILGSPTAQQVWVYLCGLTRDFNAPGEIELRKIIDQIGHNLGIKFIAVYPCSRSAYFDNKFYCFDNKFYWPQGNKQETLATYNYIVTAVDDHKIAGFVGFSNGGFFLNKLAQLMSVNKPIVSIGAAGPILFIGNSFNNVVHLLIGTKDRFHYEPAKKFYHDSQNSLLKVNLIEYDGGHTIPSKLLEDTLAQIKS